MLSRPRIIELVLTPLQLRYLTMTVPKPAADSLPIATALPRAIDCCPKIVEYPPVIDDASVPITTFPAVFAFTLD